MTPLANLTDAEIDRLAQRFFETHWMYQSLCSSGTARRVTVYQFMRWLREDAEFEKLLETVERRS